MFSGVKKLSHKFKEYFVQITSMNLLLDSRFTPDTVILWTEDIMLNHTKKTGRPTVSEGTVKWVRIFLSRNAAIQRLRREMSYAFHRKVKVNLSL